MKKRLLWAGWGTLLLFPLLGWFILQFFEPDALQLMFRGEISIIWQLLSGLMIGLGCGFIARFVVSRPFMENIETKYARMINQLNLNTGTIIFLSFCAGFGEELLFRGAIQPLLGIWITAIVFVAIHGYINPTNWRISIYGITMTLIIALLGWMTEIWGIWSAGAAHMAIDIVLFQHLVKQGKKYNAIQSETTP